MNYRLVVLGGLAAGALFVSGCSGDARAGGQTLVASVGVHSQYVQGAAGPVGLYVIDLPDLDRLASPAAR